VGRAIARKFASQEALTIQRGGSAGVTSAAGPGGNCARGKSS